MSKKAALDLTAEQVRYFRARRSHLVGDGAKAPATCAKELLGAQAQVHTCALHAISLRTAGRPSAADIEREIFDAHTMLRTWGQRGTLHLYDAEDWPMVVHARRQWATSGRSNGMPSDALLEEISEVFAASDKPMTRSDLTPLMPEDYIEELRDHPGAGKTPERFAASRVIWSLSKRGVIAHADAQGREQGYAHRELWWPHVEWKETSEKEANQDVIRRYLGIFGPSSVQDVAHYMGARVSDTREWMKGMEEDVFECTQGEHKKLLALKEDRDELQVTPGEWPARLLPAYDTMLMTHKNKRWILPDAAEEKQIWKKAAVVVATAIDRGQIVGTWSHNKRSKEVDITLTPLGGWSDDARDALEADAQAFASHLGLELGAFEIEK